MHRTHSPSGPDEPASQLQAGLPNVEFEFAGQTEHVEASFAPRTAEYVPISQSVQVSAPASALYFPATHSKHVATSDAPTVAEYVPIPQSVHVPDPANALYFPATHNEHVLSSGPVDPARHVQIVEPVTMWEFAGQGDGSHGPPSGPKNPSLHVQFSTASLPVSELELVGQSLHA